MNNIVKEKVENLRKRWKSNPSLIDTIIEILKGNDKVKSPIDYKERLYQVLKALEYENIHMENENKFVVSGERVATMVIGTEDYGITSLPYIDLRGIDISRKYCSGMMLVGLHMEYALFSGSYLEITDFRGSYLTGASFIVTQLEGAKFLKCDLNAADFSFAYLKGADFSGANISGASFMAAEMGVLSKFHSNNSLDEEEKAEYLKYNHNTIFSSNDYLPVTNLFSKSLVFNSDRGIVEISYFKYVQNYWFFTDFRDVDTNGVGFSGAMDLERYINDQQYLIRFRYMHKMGYFLWNLLSNCGGSIWRVAFWALLAIVGFAALYGTLPWPNHAPSLVPDWLIMHGPAVNPNAYGLANAMESSNLPGWAMWFFVSFDIFTNLGIRSTQPLNVVGVFLVFIETILGYVSLGLMISVFANKFARRAG